MKGGPAKRVRVAGDEARKGGQAAARRHEMEHARAGVEKVRKQRAVAPEQLPHAAKDRLARAKRAYGQVLRDRRAADGEVVLDRGHAGELLAVAAGHPADAEPGQAEGFGHDAKGDRALVQVAGRGQRRDPFGLGKTVDLVGKHPGPVFPGHFEHGREHLGRGHVSRGVVREIEHQSPASPPEQRPEFGHVRGESPGRVAQPGGRMRAKAHGHVGQGLVAGRGHDDGVTRGERGRHEGVDGFLGPDMNQDVVRGNGFVEPGDGLAQLGSAPGIGVAQAQTGKPGLGPGHEREQVGHGQGLAVGGAKQPRRGEFMFGEKAFQAKRGELHGDCLPCALGIVLLTGKSGHTDEFFSRQAAFVPGARIGLRGRAHAPGGPPGALARPVATPAAGTSSRRRAHRTRRIFGLHSLGHMPRHQHRPVLAGLLVPEMTPRIRHRADIVAPRELC